MSEKAHKESVKEHLYGWLDDLYAEASRVVEGHWEMLRAEERKHPGWENKSSLWIRLRRKGNSIAAEWGQAQWRGYKTRGTRRALFVEITKGRGGRDTTSRSS